MPLGDWVRPPRHLLVLFFAVTTISTAALAWSSWQLLAQERALGAQRAQERRDSTANLTVAALQQQFAALERDVTAIAALPPAEIARGASAQAREFPPAAALLVFDADGLMAYPAGRLRYYPTVPRTGDPPSTLFAEADALEFRQEDRVGAIAALRPLSASPQPAVRAHALLRLARNFRKARRPDDAIASYEALARIEDVRIDGVPADLVARGALCDLFETAGRHEDLRRAAGTLMADLQSGRWRLLRSVYDTYAARARTLLDQDVASVDDETEGLTEAALWLWDRHRANEPLEGRSALSRSGHSLLVVSRRGPGTLVAFAALPGFIESRWLTTALPDGAASDFRVALTDAEGRAVVGDSAAVASSSSVRPGPDTGLPWTMYVSSSSAAGSSFTRRSQLMLAGLAGIALLVVGGSYLIGRAVLRELHVARLQSDFVSAVSHEFRTPLTAMRQMSELLIDGRVETDDLRQQYYQVLQVESSRLQRLVEGLLKFGRMQAGAMRYQLETLDAASLVRATVDEFQREAARRGVRVELTIHDTPGAIRADREALGCALWNLLDNAVKYSPDEPVVWVDVTTAPGGVAIQVRDRGVGIPAADQPRIFGKFVRGPVAATLGVQGSGIGLAVARQIVVAHGGDIAVESVPGEGATFTIDLPAVATVADPVLGTAAPVSAGDRG